MVSYARRRPAFGLPASVDPESWLRSPGACPRGAGRSSKNHARTAARSEPARLGNAAIPRGVCAGGFGTGARSSRHRGRVRNRRPLRIRVRRRTRGRGKCGARISGACRLAPPNLSEPEQCSTVALHRRVHPSLDRRSILPHRRCCGSRAELRGRAARGCGMLGPACRSS